MKLKAESGYTNICLICFLLKIVSTKRCSIAVAFQLCFTALEYAVSRAEVNQDGLKINVTHQLLVYSDDVNTGVLIIP